VKKAYSIFHLNISFSSLAEDQKEIVIKNCYEPLIDMISKNDYKVSIEITGYTVEQIQIFNPNLIKKINECIKCKKIELVFSGFEQLIYQLTPKKIIDLNIDLGKEIFKESFGFIPKIFWANEQCFTSDMLRTLSEAGFESIIIEKENLQKKLDIESNEPIVMEDLNGYSLNIVWNSSYYFQLFQRIIHGEYSLDKANNIYSNLSREDLPLCIYGSDAEVFNYRPKRFHEEANLNDKNEWVKIEQLYRIIENNDIQTCFIAEILKSVKKKKIVSSSEIDFLDNPVYVKKQKKYNLSRWALTGRNDIDVNTRAIRLIKNIDFDLEIDYESKKNLVALFSSDIRTHIEEKRWNLFIENLLKLEQKFVTEIACNKKKNLLFKKINKNFFEFTNQNYIFQAEPRKGLAIKKLEFKNNPIKIGKLEFGHFNDIDYLADYYSGNYLIETNEIPRYSDLSSSSSEVSDTEKWLHLRSETTLINHQIVKQYSLSKNSPEFLVNYDFSNLPRQYGFIRVCYLTLTNFDELDNFFISYPVDQNNIVKLGIPELDFNHGMAISKKISSRTFVPAKLGVFNIHANDSSLEISWDTCKAAIYPMAELTRIGQKNLFRIFFSIGESDETFKIGGMYKNLELKIRPEK